MDRSHASGAAAFAAIVLVVAACTSSPATASPSPATQSPGASPTAAGSVAVTSPSARPIQPVVGLIRLPCLSLHGKRPFDFAHASGP